MKNAVRNLVAVSAATPEISSAARAAVLELARTKDPEGTTEDAQGRVVFTVEWEPVFKEMKEISTKFKEASFTLYGDSFAKQHWVSKTVYQAGKASEDVTLSRIDGDQFGRVYQEVFGETFASKR